MKTRFYFQYRWTAHKCFWDIYLMPTIIIGYMSENKEHGKLLDVNMMIAFLAWHIIIGIERYEEAANVDQTEI